MGADGAIDIYDKEILESITGETYTYFDSAHQYVHTIFGKQVITDYRGDNLWNHYCLYCGKEDCSDSNDYKEQGTF